MDTRFVTGTTKWFEFSFMCVAASSQLLDVMNNSACNPCTHCSFRIRVEKGSESTAILQKSNFCILATPKILKKLLKQRLNGKSSFLASFSGMKQRNYNAINGTGMWPKQKPAAGLRKVSSWIPQTLGDFPAIQRYLDAYLPSMVAPKQLLTGTWRDHIEVWFWQFEDKRKRKNRA